MFAFLVCIIMLLIGSMHVKYLYKKDSPRISFSFVNAYHLVCYHLIFVFVKTKTCMSPPATLSSPAIWLSTPLYIAKNVCFRDAYLNVQWDYTANLYQSSTKYSKILHDCPTTMAQLPKNQRLTTSFGK